MRCGCPNCGAFMIHEELSESACVCPVCNYRCNACLGTGTAITREDLQKMRETEWFAPQFNGESDNDEPFSPEPPDVPKGF
jgi:hypothetical protein